MLSLEKIYYKWFAIHVCLGFSDEIDERATPTTGEIDIWRAAHLLVNVMARRCDCCDETRTTCCGLGRSQIDRRVKL